MRSGAQKRLRQWNLSGKCLKASSKPPISCTQKKLHADLSPIREASFTLGEDHQLMSRLKLTTLIVGGFAAMFAILLITNIFSIRGVEEQKKLSLDFQGITERAALSSNLELGLEKQSAGVRAFALTNSDKLLARDEEGKNDLSPQ
jgi:hypothetical protein